MLLSVLSNRSHSGSCAKQARPLALAAMLPKGLPKPSGQARKLSEMAAPAPAPGTSQVAATDRCENFARDHALRPYPKRNGVEVYRCS